MPFIAFSKTSARGGSDFKTTQGYIDLAGETFRAEAEVLERRLFGSNALEVRG